MKRFIFYLTILVLAFPLFSQGIKESDVLEIKDEIASNGFDVSTLSLNTREDESIKRRILDTDTSLSSSSIIIRYSSGDGNAFVEYGESYLYYSLILDGHKIELKASEDGALLFLDDTQVGREVLSENILLFEKAFIYIDEVLSSPEGFTTTEIKKYYGERWETSLYWNEGERIVRAEILYVPNDDSSWFISGYIEKDKIKDTFTPLNIFVQPYFILERVEKDGEERDMRLW